ncbi:hypothetical protein ACVW06_002847 [Pantoea ananatis]
MPTEQIIATDEAGPFWPGGKCHHDENVGMMMG